MSLQLQPNIPDPDGFYQELIGMQRELDDEQATLLQARLLLVLANHVGDRTVLSQAMEVARRADPKLVWVAVFRQVGAPINTACLGAAGAFLVSLFTDFAGAADLGLIAGGGLLLCLLAGYTFLPAILTLFPDSRMYI